MICFLCFYRTWEFDKQERWGWGEYTESDNFNHITINNICPYKETLICRISDHYFIINYIHKPLVALC